MGGAGPGFDYSPRAFGLKAREVHFPVPTATPSPTKTANLRIASSCGGCLGERGPRPRRLRASLGARRAMFVLACVVILRIDGTQRPSTVCRRRRAAPATSVLAKWWCPAPAQTTDARTTEASDREYRRLMRQRQAAYPGIRSSLQLRSCAIVSNHPMTDIS